MSYHNGATPYVLILVAVRALLVEARRTRQRGGEDKDMETGTVIASDQRLSRSDALRAFTINGAYLTFEEDKKGSIEVGKFADLAVLSADLMTIPADDIYDIQVLMTVVGGLTVFDAMNSH